MTGILLISSSYRPDVGGVETHLQDLVSFLKKRGYKVTVLTFQPYQSAISKAQRVEVEKETTIFRLPRPWRSILFADNCWRPASQIFYLPILFLFSTIFILLHRKEINVVHTHGILPTPIACFVSKLFKKRCVMSLHHTYIPNGRIQSTLARIILSLPDKVLCLSDRSKLELLRIGLKNKSVRTFTYWIDQTTFQPTDKNYCKKLLGLEDKFVVLFVGRLIEEKGVRLLLAAAKKLSSILDKICFVFVGLGPLAQEVIDASKDLKTLRFQGAVENKDLPVYYNAADVVVVPSISEEGFGRVILESLACGTPVIASNRGGIPEVLNPSVGILIEPVAESLANAIIRLYSNRDELMNLASNCRIYTQKRFTEDNAKLIEETYFERLR
jgi:glycosyltransferase involved in cell wall biosynthesis